jgi:chitodextrinase
MQTHSDKLARIKDWTEMSRRETFFWVTDQYFKNVWYTYKIWVPQSGEYEGCGLYMFNKNSEYYSVWKLSGTN